MNDPAVRASHRGPSSIEPAPGWFDLLEVTADPRRRSILAVVRESGELPIDDLSARARNRCRGSGEDSGLSPITFHHVHLPNLEAVDLVEVTDDGESIRPGPAFDPDTVDALLRDDEPEPVDDATIAALEAPRRRLAVSVMADAGGLVEVDELADAVAARTARSDWPDEPTPDPAVVLHHVDLPRLDAAGVVDYDPDEGLATYLGLPDGLALSVGPV